MGVVYLATDVSLGRNVALKTLPHVSASLAARLQREARAMARILHPNLAVIYGAEQWRGNPVLIVEYLEGGTVLDTLRRGAFSVREMLGLGILIADVLDRLHGIGILHRDVKPSNIGYTLAGTPKLLDLGLAGAFAHKEPARAGAARQFEVASVHGDYAMASDSSQLGTLRYMAPEALRGQAPQPAFDLWALSLVLYEVMAGRHPLAHAAGPGLVNQLQRAEFPDVREFRADCPPAIADYLRAALAADPSKRPATAAEMRTRLQHLLPDAPGAVH
jgi:serine/threonine protein kinase